MATIEVCDGGCGTGISHEAIVLGLIEERTYCDNCAKTVQTYLDDRDKLHSALALKWQQDLEKLQAAWVVKHPNGVLPDVH